MLHKKSYYSNNFISHGLDSLYIYKYISKNKELLSIMDELLSFTYHEFLGNTGYYFLKKYLTTIKKVTIDFKLKSLITIILEFREEFKQLGLLTTYTETFRPSNINKCLKLLDKSIFNGKIIDIGSGDNCLGKMCIKYSKDVTNIVGVDIYKNTNLYHAKKLEFRFQNNPSMLPANKNEFDIAICRYSLHHMSFKQQYKIISEINRVLKPGGTFIIYENTFSNKIKPLNSINSLDSTYNKILNLNFSKRKLLYSLMDTFSLGIKDKNQPFPFTYRNIEDWQNVLTGSKFKIQQINYYSLPTIDLHQVPLGIFICSNNKGE